MVMACEDMLGCWPRQSIPPGPVSGVYYGRGRNYSSSLGTWISQGPAGYPGAAAHTRLGGGTGFRGVEFCEYLGRCAAPLKINGDNTYQFVMENTVVNLDHRGEGFWGWVGAGRPSASPPR